MSKQKDPAFLMYSKDWLEGTAEFTPSEKGVYIDLLCYQHQRGHIPEDTTRLARLVGMPHKEFLRVWKAIAKKFDRRAEGELTNKKMDKVSNDRSVHSKMRTIVGTFGAMLRASEISNTTAAKIRKQFNWKEFQEIPANELSKELSIWLAKCLANAKHIIGNANANAIANDNNIKYPFSSEVFLVAWNRWKQYKSDQHGFHFKTQDTEQTSINKLAKDAGNNEQIALEIIENSIANGYQGLFKSHHTKDTSKKLFTQQVSI